MDIKVQSCLSNTELFNPEREERTDLIQLFVFVSHLAEKCVIVRSQLAHMVQLHFSRFIYH